MTFDVNALRDMRDPHAMIRHLEGLRAEAEQRLERLRQEQERVDAITVTRTDPQGMATVTVGHDGELRDLAIDPHLGRQRYRRLGQAVITALAAAREELQERLAEAAPRRAG